MMFSRNVPSKLVLQKLLQRRSCPPCKRTRHCHCPLGNIRRLPPVAPSRILPRLGHRSVKAKLTVGGSDTDQLKERPRNGLEGSHRTSSPCLQCSQRPGKEDKRASGIWHDKKGDKKYKNKNISLDKQSRTLHRQSQTV